MDSVNLIGDPLSNFTVKVTIKNNDSRIKNNVYFNVDFRKCLEGEKLTDSGKCEFC